MIGAKSENLVMDTELSCHRQTVDLPNWPTRNTFLLFWQCNIELITRDGSRIPHRRGRRPSRERRQHVFFQNKHKIEKNLGRMGRPLRSATDYKIYIYYIETAIVIDVCLHLTYLHPHHPFYDGLVWQVTTRLKWRKCDCQLMYHLNKYFSNVCW